MLQARRCEPRGGRSGHRLPRGGRLPALVVCLLSSTLGRAQITLDGSFGPTDPIAGPNYVIGAEVGQISGNNLFHSFSQFNIHAGESAAFTGPSGTANVIARVTGGLPSSIDGAIDSRSSMPSASLFLLNPSGVMLGPNASLNVGGSFHVSTADYLRFADGAQYFASLARQSTLTIADPVAFGFLSPTTAASVLVDGSNLSVDHGQTISLIGRNVRIADAALIAPGGQVYASAEGTGEISIRPSDRPATPASGAAEIARSTLDVSGDPAGTVRVRGGRLIIDDSSVHADTAGNADVAQVGIDLQAGAQLQITRATLRAQTSGDGRGGGIRIAGGDISLSGSSVITQGGALDVAATGTITMSEGAGLSSQAFDRDAGLISVAGPQIVLDNGFISTATFGPGRAGRVSLAVGSLDLVNGGQIASSTMDASTGAGGNIEIAATGSVMIAGGSPTGESPLPEPLRSMIGDGSSGIFSMAFSLDETAASGGTISLVGSPDMTLSYGGKLFAATFGPAAAGSIVLNAGTLTVDTGATIASMTGGAGAGGGIILKADQIRLEFDSSIGSSSFAGGRGGDIFLAATEFGVLNASLSTEVGGEGAGGNVEIRAAHTSMDNGFISSYNGAGEDAGGSIVVRGTSLTMDRSASIGSVTEFSGKGGDVVVEVDNLSVTGGASLATATNGAGAAGNVRVTGNGDAFIADPFSQLSSISFAEGPVGDLVVDFRTVVLTREAQIKAGSVAGTLGGKLEVTADAIVISDGAGMSSEATRGDLGPIKISAPTLLLDDGFISTATLSTGKAGRISLDVGSLLLVNGGQIASSSTSNAVGAGGSIDVVAPQGVVSISGRSPSGVSPIPESFKLAINDASSGIFSTASSANVDAGRAGSITVSARQLTLADGGKLSVASLGAGAAGEIAVHAEAVKLTTGGRIDSGASAAGHGGTIVVAATDLLSLRAGAGLSSNAAGTGPGGDINAAARNIELLAGSTISASSTGSSEATAGNVNIVFGDSMRLERSAITTRSLFADGGNIAITSTGSTLTLIDSQIATSVQSGAGSGGNITVGSHLHPIDFVILANSGILANAFGGNGGNIDIFADTYLPGGSLIDASSVQREPGRINIEARITDLSGSLAELPDNFLQAADLLRAACAARVIGGKASSLVVAAREGVPPEPGGLLASPLGTALSDFGAAPSEEFGSQTSLQLAGLWPASRCTR